MSDSEAASTPSARAALLLLAVALILAPVPFGSVEPWSRGLLVALLAGVGICASVALARHSQPFPADIKVAAGFLLLTAVTTLSSAVRPVSLDRLVLLCALFAAYATVALLVSPAQARRFAVLMAVMTTLCAVYGLAELLSKHDAVLWVEKVAYRGSLTGPFINRNHAASFLALGAFVAAGLGLAPGIGRRQRLLWGGCLVLLVSALALTLSRGGLIAAVVAAPVFLALLRVRRGRLVVVVLIVPLLLATWLVVSTGGGLLAERFFSSFDRGEDVSILARLSFWRSSLRAIGERPWIGWGPGTFASAYPRFREAEVVGRVPYAHNEYVELAMERGLLGCLAAIALGLAFVATVRRRSDTVVAPSLRAGLLAGLTVVAAHAAVDFAPKIPAIALYATVAAALARNLGLPTAVAEASTRRARSWVFRIALILCTLVGLRGITQAISDSHRRRAAQEFSEVDWVQATDSYRRALRWDPISIGATEGLARSLQNRHKFSRDPALKAQLELDALAAFERALQLNPLSADLRIQLAWLHAFGRDDDRAIEAYRSAVSADPMNANTLYHFGSFLLHRGRSDEGFEMMRRAVRILPKLFGGKIHELHYLLRDPARVAALIPDEEPFLLFQYAVYLLEKDELKVSREYFERAYSTGRNPENWLVDYAEILARRLGGPAATELLASRPAELQTAGVLNQRIRYLVGPGGDGKAALPLLVEGQSKWPGDAALLAWRIGLELADGEAELALEAAERYRAAGGSCVFYALQRCRVHRAIGDRDGLREAAEIGLTCEPGQADLLAQKEFSLLE